MTFQASFLRLLPAVKRLLGTYEEDDGPKTLSAPISAGSCKKCSAPLYKVIIRVTDWGSVAREPTPCLIAITIEPFKIRTDGRSVDRRLIIGSETLAESLGIGAVLHQFDRGDICGFGAFCAKCEELELQYALQPPARGEVVGTPGEPQTRFVKRVRQELNSPV